MVDFGKTALVLIDFQKGIIARWGAENLLEQATKLCDTFRKHHAFIAYVHVDFIDEKDLLSPPADSHTPVSKPPKGWADFADELGVTHTDYIVTKRQWGAFFGTDLDLQLRRRGIDTIVLCGILTNIGVESTAREAYQYGYKQIFIHDAMKAASTLEHEHTLSYIFPRIGKTISTAEFIAQTK